jgi:hypothetical protein
MKINPVGAKLSHADGRMDGQMVRHDKANGHFLLFANAPKN